VLLTNACIDSGPGSEAGDLLGHAGDPPWNTELEFGQALIRWRRDSSLTLRMASRILGVSPSTVLKWERGVSPRPHTLQDVAEGLGVPLEHLRRQAPSSTVYRPETAGGARTRPLAAARLHAGYSQAGLARQLNVSYATMSKWECGLQRPHMHDVRRLAQALDLPVSHVQRMFDDVPASTRDCVGRLPGLDARLRALSITPEQLASAIGSTEGYARQISQGRRTVPSGLWPAIADLAQVDVDEGLALLRDRPPAPEPSIVRRLRRARRLSQRELSASTGIALSRIAALDRGARSATPSEVKRLASMLRCSVTELAGALDVDLRPVAPSEFDRADVARLLRAARLAIGLARHQAARALGVTSETIKRWERGSSEPKPARWPWIAKVYGLDEQATAHWLSGTMPGCREPVSQLRPGTGGMRGPAGGYAPTAGARGAWDRGGAITADRCRLG